MNPHILIVDDEGEFRMTLNVLLGMEGFQVSEASSGNHALELIESGLRPDVLLLDFRMPGLNGGQTLDRVRALAIDAPAILLTAAGEAEAIARRHGFDAVMVKPFGPDDLLRALRQLLASS